MVKNAANLKPTLWEAANTLRSSAVDRADWKGYILPFLPTKASVIFTDVEENCNLRNSR